MTGQSDKIIKLQEELTECMKKEVGLMREVLANMHQEEVSLIMFDKHSWTKTMQDRFLLIQRLSSLRKTRIETTHSMENLLSSPNTGKKMPLEKILPESQSESCEIFYLSDQILALTERMNIQHTKNEVLMKNYEIHLHSPSHFHQGIPLSKEETKKAKSKAAVATYPHDEP